MIGPQIKKIVDAVLYEGFTLYPYRPSAKKNRQRFTFGRAYPRAYSVAQKGAERFAITTECLASSQDGRARIEVSVCFLQVVAREILKFSEPIAHLPESFEPNSLEVVPELELDGQLYLTWQEAVEREVNLPATTLVELWGAPHQQAFDFAASTEFEPVKNDRGLVSALIRRRRGALSGTIEMAGQQVSQELTKVSLKVANLSPIADSELDDRDAILLRTFASTHMVFHLQEGKFISLMDPPPAIREFAQSCHNEGTWPVLVGEEETDDRSTMLSSPIILYDYPKIAPESPGELFDGTEIDEILTLRVLTMTDEEKREMRQSDDRSRRILERTESLSDEQLWKLHGTVRELRSVDSDFFGSSRRLDVVEVEGGSLRVGDRVRIRPKSRADIMDMALEGKTALIEAIEEDAENRIYLALVLEDDPGKDLGLLRQPGHRFFYSVHEVERL
jgi:hypothetical protein